MKTITFRVWLCCLFALSLSTHAQQSASMRIDMEPDKLIFPGNTLSMDIDLISASGDTLKTNQVGKRRLPWRKLYIESSVDDRIRNGMLHIPRDLSLLQKKEFTIRVYDRKKQHLYGEQTIAYHYPTEAKPVVENSFTKAPGFTTSFSVWLHWNNGTTSWAGKHSSLLSLSDFRCRAEGGNVENGKLHIASDIHAFTNHTVALYAAPVAFVIPQVDVCVFQLDYKARYWVSRPASSGSCGRDGCNGGDGGPSQSGGNGHWGTPGGDGEPGGDVDVYVDAHYDEVLQTTLVDVTVDTYTQPRRQYRVHGQDGKVSISASGGDGGKGGDGGNGGDGGCGLDGAIEKVRKKINDSTYVEETIKHPGMPGGHGGDGGCGGPGGNGGDGGNIHVHYTDAAQAYLHVLDLSTSGGDGGRGGSGGWRGSGGRGGSGEPNGASGCNGKMGLCGPSGYDGRNGQVFYYPLSPPMN